MEPVSVIIPSYRQAQFLHRAVTSVLDQGYDKVEVIIVDDYSCDRSLAVALDLRSKDRRVRVLARQENGGSGGARNTGLMAANSSYVTFLDADDYLLPDSISARMAALESAISQYGERLAGAYGDWQHVGESVDDPPSIKAPRRDLPVIDRSFYRGDNPFISSSPIVRRDRLIDIGGFGEGLPMIEDFTAWIRIIEAGGVFAPVEHLVCAYRQHPMSQFRERAHFLPTAVRAINDWWVERGWSFGDGGRLSAWLEGGDPREHERLTWMFTSGVAEQSGALPPARHLPEPAYADVYLQVRRELGRSSRDLQDALIGVVEAAREEGIGQLCATATPSEPDVILVPTDLEGALECRALVPHLRERGLDVQLGMERKGSLEFIWPSALTDVPIRRLNASHSALHVVFSRSDKLATRLAAKLGRERVALRPTGTTVFRPYQRGYTRRYRSSACLLLRSRIEAAELGDRIHCLVPSGARFGITLPREPISGLAIFVSDDQIEFPALEAWISAVFDTVGRSGESATLVGSPLVANRLPTLRLVDPRPELMAGRVVLSACHEITLVEALGGSPIIFDPGFHQADFTPRWVAAHPVARTPEQLRSQLLSSSPAEPTDAWSEVLARVTEEGLAEPDWAAMFVAALHPLGLSASVSR